MVDKGLKVRIDVAMVFLLGIFLDLRFAIPLANPVNGDSVGCFGSVR